MSACAKASELHRGVVTVNNLPIKFGGKVISGFGRGSKELGCPTANLPIEPYEETLASIPTGVYFGWASLEPKSDENSEFGKFMAAINIGWSPYYQNTQKTIEAHLLHHFEGDFYGQELKLIVLGYIRPEENFNSLGMFYLFKLLILLFYLFIISIHKNYFFLLKYEIKIINY